MGEVLRVGHLQLEKNDLGPRERKAVAEFAELLRLGDPVITKALFSSLYIARRAAQLSSQQEVGSHEQSDR